MKDKLSYPPSSVRWLRFSPTELPDSVASSLTEILIQGTLLSGYLAYWKNLAELSLLGDVHLGQGPLHLWSEQGIC